MKIILIGGHGTIGKFVNEALSLDHEVLVGGRSKGDIIVDMADPQSILNMYQKHKNIDAVICIAGDAKWDTIDKLSEADFMIGIRSKMMGQINLVRIGKDFVKPQGSFTLTTGILADYPVPMTASAAAVNGAIHSFTKAVSLEIKQNVNVISAGLVEPAYEKYKDYFPGHVPVPINDVTEAYVNSISQSQSGKIIRVYGKIDHL